MVRDRADNRPGSIVNWGQAAEVNRTVTIVTSEMAEATGTEPAPSEPARWATSGSSPGLSVVPLSRPRWPSRRNVSASPRYRARAGQLASEQEATVRAQAATKSLRSLAAEFGVSHETIRTVLRDDLFVVSEAVAARDPSRKIDAATEATEDVG